MRPSQWVQQPIKGDFGEDSPNFSQSPEREGSTHKKFTYNYNLFNNKRVGSKTRENGLNQRPSQQPKEEHPFAYLVSPEHQVDPDTKKENRKNLKIILERAKIYDPET